MSQTSVFSNIQVYGKNKETVTGFYICYDYVYLLLLNKNLECQSRYPNSFSKIGESVTIHFDQKSVLT